MRELGWLEVRDGVTSLSDIGMRICVLDPEAGEGTATNHTNFTNLTRMIRGSFV